MWLNSVWTASMSWSCRNAGISVPSKMSPSLMSRSFAKAVLAQVDPEQTPTLIAQAPCSFERRSCIKPLPDVPEGALLVAKKCEFWKSFPGRVDPGHLRGYNVSIPLGKAARRLRAAPCIRAQLDIASDVLRPAELFSVLSEEKSYGITS